MAHSPAGERTERNHRIAAALSAEENRPLEAVYPRHPLQGKGKSPVSDKGGVCGFGHHHGRHKGHPGRLDRGAREQQVLAECAERSQKQGSFGRRSIPLSPRMRLWKIIYTTNIIEGLNRQFRQITKNKPSFANDDSLHKSSFFCFL